MLPFYGGYDPIREVNLINGIIAVDYDDRTGHILELNNFLDFYCSMDDIILVPMLAGVNGITINDIPKDISTYETPLQNIVLSCSNRTILICKMAQLHISTQDT